MPGVVGLADVDHVLVARGQPVHRKAEVGVVALAQPEQRARLGLARTFQRIELFGGLSVRDHLLVAERARRGGGSLWRDLLGRAKPSAEEQERCDEMLELVGLTAVADRPAGALARPAAVALLARGRVAP